MEINIEIARRVLETVDAGLVKGVGKAIPGQMCVEVAVNYAMGLPHGDNPSCVAPALRAFTIRLNDANWSSNAARAAGMRRLSLVQLGSAEHFDHAEFRRRIVKWAISTCVPFALRAAASVQKDAKHKAALLNHAAICERDGTCDAAVNAKKAAAYAADSAAYAADAVDARDKSLARFAEDAVQILIEMNVPGVQWLILAPVEASNA